MQVIEMLLGQDRKKWGVHKISLVEVPAVEENFIALNSHEIKLKEIDKEKRLLLGAVLIPEQKILRKHKDGTPYYIYFSAETIEEASQDYLKFSRQGEATQDHKEDIDGVTVVESWIVMSEEHDKSRAFGLDYPVGTWVVAMKVDNDEIWNDYVKTGKVKGFSIEGYFTDETQLSAVEDEDVKTINAIKDLLNEIE